MRSLLLALALLAGSAASTVRAATLVFTYGSGATEIGGTLEGTLQPDGNTFIVSGGSNFTLGGSVVYATPPNNFGSYDELGLGVPGLSGTTAGLVTLDGTLMDLIVADSVTLGFAFSVGGAVANFLGGPIAAGAGTFDAIGATPFDPTLWSASLVAVPEPVGLALFGAGLAGLAVLRRPGAARPVRRSAA